MKKEQFLVKEFEIFSDGLKELIELSYSAKQAITAFDNPNPLNFRTNDELKYEYNVEKQAVANLANNIVFDIQGRSLNIDITSFGVNYTTTGGTRFGWDKDKEDIDDPYTFFIQHRNKIFPDNSTLLKSGLDVGWELKECDTAE